MKSQKVTNWGNFPEIEASVSSFSSEKELKKLLTSSEEIIARGMGRCYGDSSLCKNIISTLKYNRIIDFNEVEQTVCCESGVTLEDLLSIFVPRGLFLPVTPGTKFVTIGGAIASDVHGKNHHVGGSISNHIISMDIMLSDGSISSCSKNNNSNLFWSTCGGMGLTGIILNACFKLKKIETSYIIQESIKAENLESIMKHFEESKDYTYSVAWIDCLSKGKKLGRSILMRGEHASVRDLEGTKFSNNPLKTGAPAKLDIPLFFPNFSLNTLSVKAFNFLYYNKQLSKKKKFIIDYDKFFYPLDGINNWNRIYGKRGFTQYQFVLPKETSYNGLEKILTEISNSGSCSFLAVLKLFGEQDNLISFPKEGYTLALDFPIKPGVFELLNKLDEIVLENGGRLYLTKDTRMTEETFNKSYERAEIFRRIKHQLDNHNKFQSLQSKRIKI
ncbi:MAG: FAD-binding oxidoreductase [Cyanobacteriota bacterium]